MKYDRGPNGEIGKRVDLDPSGVAVELVATGVRRERTGAHALVSIIVGQKRVAYTNFNVGRDKERTSLANSAHRQLGKHLQELVPAQQIKSILDEFCFGLWEAHVGRIEIEQMVGNLDSPGALPLVEPYAYLEAGTAIFGPPKRGKSLTAMGIAITADAGLIDSPFGSAKSPVRTLLLNLERSRASMERRLAQMNRALGLPADRPIACINRRGATLSDIEDLVRQKVAEDRYKLIVFDSISRAGFGTLVADDVANQIFDTLNSFGVAYIAVGHTPRGDDSHLFGSQMQSAALDMEIAVITERDEESGKLGVALKAVSANDVAWPATRYLSYEFDDSGLTDVRLAPASEFASLGASTRTIMQQIEDHLLEVGSATASEISEDLSIHRPNVAKKLKNSRFVKLPRVGRRVPYGLRCVSPDMSPQTDGGPADVSLEDTSREQDT